MPAGAPNADLAPKAFDAPPALPKANNGAELVEGAPNALGAPPPF